MKIIESYFPIFLKEQSSKFASKSRLTICYVKLDHSIRIIYPLSLPTITRLDDKKSKHNGVFSNM